MMKKYIIAISLLVSSFAWGMEQKAQGQSYLADPVYWLSAPGKAHLICMSINKELSSEKFNNFFPWAKVKKSLILFEEFMLNGVLQWFVIEPSFRALYKEKVTSNKGVKKIHDFLMLNYKQGFNLEDRIKKEINPLKIRVPGMRVFINYKSWNEIANKTLEWLKVLEVKNPTPLFLCFKQVYKRLMIEIRDNSLIKMEEQDRRQRKPKQVPTLWQKIKSNWKPILIGTGTFAAGLYTLYNWWTSGSADTATVVP